jgi:hypothetical protein
MSASLKYTNVKPEEIAFQPPHDRSNGRGKHMWIQASATNKGKVQFQTAKCYVPFDVTPDEQNESKAAITMNVEDPAFVEVLDGIDAAFAAYCMENKATIFPGKSDVWITTNQFNCIKRDDEGKYAPKFKAKIMLEGRDDQKTDILVGRIAGDDILCNKGEIGDLVKGSQAVAIVSLNSGWFGSIGWGLEFRVDQILVYKPDRKRSIEQFDLGANLILEDGEVAEDKANKPPAEKQARVEVPAVLAGVVDDTVCCGDSCPMP